MPISNIDTVNWEFGEIAPKAAARFDLAIGQNGAERIENCVVLPQGGLTYRRGFRRVAYTRRNKKAWLIEFQFNDAQAYLLEATDQYFRFYKDNGLIVENPTTITGASKANPAVVTDVAHGYSVGDEVFINDVVGMSELNGKSYIISATTANTYTLTDVFGADVDSTGYGTYSSGGIAERVYELATPYTEAELPFLKFTQNANTMYMCHPSHAPRKLTRSGDTSWTLSTFVRTADPFGAGNWPKAAAFTTDGRLMYAGTDASPEKFWVSRSPNASGPRYDDLTTGTNADDGFTFTLAPVKGRVDVIEWATATDKFMVTGTFGTVRRLFGASEAEPMGPNSINAPPVGTFGCAPYRPISIGTTVFYIERSGKRIRSFEYDYRIDSYVSVNRNLVSDHLTDPGLIELKFQGASPNVLWSVRTDGVLLGFTYEDKEDKAGWHRHTLGGDSKVLSVGIMPRATQAEQLWAVTETEVNGNTTRNVCFMEDEPDFPIFDDFWKGVGVETFRERLERYWNALYEVQKNAFHLDLGVTYNGVTDVAITPSGAVLDAEITLQADGSFFTSDMVGREIWKAYDADGIGGGRALITAYTSPTEVNATVIAAFDGTAEIPAGSSYLTAKTLSGLDHLEGREIAVISDGSTEPNKTVQNGSITLDTAGSIVHAGLPYVGVIKTMNLEMAGVTGATQTKERNIDKLICRYLHTSGVFIGPSLDRLSPVIFRESTQITDRPVPLFTGNREARVDDVWDNQKHVYIVQNSPLPMTLLSTSIYGDVSDEQ